MLSDQSISAVERAAGPLNNPVRLILFTSDVGCMTCDDMQELGQLIKRNMDKVALEIYDVVMDRDKSQLYGVRHVPTLVIEGRHGSYVAIQGLVKGVWLQLVLETIQAVSKGKRWFPDDVVHALSHLSTDVTIRAFVEEECGQCVQTAKTCMGLALENALIRTDVVIAAYFPELKQKLHVMALPEIVLGNNLRLEGHAAGSEIIETLFQAEGIKPGPDKRCLICGQSAEDLICTNCKTKVQAEAFEHKLRSQRTDHHETP